MKTRLAAVLAVLLGTFGGTAVAASTLCGSGCCPLCK